MSVGEAARFAENLLPIIRIRGEDLHYRIEDRLAHYGCSGASVALINQGSVAWADGFGTIEPDGPRVDRNTLFSGASISKPVTAAIALQLVEQGWLSLDEDVNRRLKSWKVPENDFTRESPVTLRWLLSHKAGTTVHGFGGQPDDGEFPTLVEMLEGLPPALNAPVRVDKTPGGVNRYSGGGTTIVQLLISEATGQAYEEVAQERILGPLGMGRSTFKQPLPPSLRGNAAEAVEENGRVTRRDFRVPQVAAGGIWTTAGDYARFMTACRDAALGRPNPLFGPLIADEMFTRQGGGGFGLGWELANEGSSFYFHHSGSNQGFQCNAVCYLESGQGAVVMTNAESGLSLYWEILNGLAELYNWPAFMSEPKQITPIFAEDFNDYVGDFAIVSGVELPLIRIFAEDGRLKSVIPGMRGGARDVMLDQNGRMFNRVSPFETWLSRGADGRVNELVVRDRGGAEIIRAKRADR